MEYMIEYKIEKRLEYKTKSQISLILHRHPQQAHPALYSSGTLMLGGKACWVQLLGGVFENITQSHARTLTSGGQQRRSWRSEAVGSPSVDHERIENKPSANKHNKQRKT